MSDSGSKPPDNSKRRTFAIGGVLLVGLLALTAVTLTRRATPPKAAAWPSVSRDDLAMREGKWYSRQNTNLFTGWMTETYPNGTRRSRSAISNGLLNGVCESWYTNGQMQVSEHFKDSVSDGLRQKWYANGQVESEAHIVNGEIQGTFRRWYDNGQLAEEITMKGGQPDGSALAYYPSGFAKAETEARAGKILNRKTWRDGQRRIPPSSAD